MKVGLLPFYLHLYDEVAPEHRPVVQAFADLIGRQLWRRGLIVEQAPICRVKQEFAAAVASFEQQQVEALITLHLAYSPSLEAAEVIAASSLPVVVLDTTPDYEFPFDFGNRIMVNHGIHGVQDFCNVLLRSGKDFLISAGHWEKSSVLDRVVRQVKAACLVHKMCRMRVGRVGGCFAGMGDFEVPDGSFGMTVVPYESSLRRSAEPDAEPEAEAIAAEMAADRRQYVFGGMSPAVYERTLRVCLKLRRWLKAEKLDAFSLCFRGITSAGGWETVPFLEASKAMARGLGYAGEGDVLTAALVGTLMRAFPETSFTEMFCPDWAHNRIFVSHMGEINIGLCDQKPLLTERKYIFSATGNPVVATGCFRPGPATLVNLAPCVGGGFKLLSAPVVFDAPGTPSLASNTGWFSVPQRDISSFLEVYSRLGGTRHLALCYGCDPAILEDFAHLMGWQYHEVKVLHDGAGSSRGQHQWHHGEWS